MLSGHSPVLTIGYMKFLIIFSILLLWTNAYPEVDPPNYDFSLDTLKDFMPGTSLEEVQKKYGLGTKIEEGSGGIVYRFYISQLRYKFPVFVQLKGNNVGDFFTRLPTYFLHDIFHQSLINRFGAQNQYLKKENSAVYIWNDVKGNTHVYSGSCTITCFPTYYAVYPKGSPDPLLMKFSNSSKAGKKGPTKVAPKN